MTPNAITLLFKEARDTFPPIKGKPMDNNLQLIRRNLLPILMEIPYDQLGGTHSLVGILAEATRYAANHGGATFVHPFCLPLYDGTIADGATTVVRVRAESAHQAKLDNYASFKAAECGAAKFLCKVVGEVWYNNLKDANTFYTKVTAREIIAFLDANSRGLHAIDMISLCTNMHNYYTQADSILQYINMLEDAQKKATRAGMPITNIELVMMASVAVLGAQHFPRKVDGWEGLPFASCTWTAWKTAFHLAHVKRQQQILASGKGSLLAGLTVLSRQRRRQLGILKPHSTTWLLWRRTISRSSSSSLLPTWPSRPPSRCSQQPTKKWLMRQLVGAVLWRRLRVGAGLRRQLQVGAGLRR
jgi:hypothetical protein